MRYAVNSLLNLIIDANKYTTSRLSIGKLFCPCCGERVTFYSESIDGKNAHFRHYHGTYRSDCENYVIGYCTDENRTNINHEKTEAIFFEKRGNRYLFSIRVSFSKDELDSNVDNRYRKIKCGTYFISKCSFMIIY